jgi:hypothetical protein
MKSPFLTSFVTVLAGGAFFAYDIQAELVARWLFDEGSGTSYADSSGKGWHARPTNPVTWSSEVPSTGFANPACVDFDGVTGYVTTPFQGIGGAEARTVAFWVKSAATNDHGIVGWGSSDANGTKWHIRLNASGANGPLGAIRTETQGDYTIGSTFIADDQWHHVACVYPGGGELGTVLHYIDGILEIPGGNNASTQAVNTSLVSDPVIIGRRRQTTNQLYFQGRVDDVRIYDRELNAREVADLTGATPTTSGLVFHLPFDEGSGTLAGDLSPNGSNGLLMPAIGILPTWTADAPPPLGHSLLFAGGGDHLVTDYPGIQGSASRSLTFWFRTTNTADNGIIGWGNSATNGLKWHARINSAAADGPLGALRLEIQGGRAVATTVVADGQWHHAAIVFEEDADPDVADIVFYLDGQLDPTSNLLSVPIDTQSSGGGAVNVTLGARFQGTVLRSFLGNLADMRIYDSGLTPSEVQEIMAGGGVEPSSDFRITALDYTPGGTSATITWNSRPGKVYTVQSTSDFLAPWTEEVDGWPTSGSSTSYTITGIGPGTDRLFFRVVEE